MSQSVSIEFACTLYVDRYFKTYFSYAMIDLKIISSKEYDKMKKKRQLIIHFGFHRSPFGKCLVGLLDERICHVSFVNVQDSINLNVLKSQWPGSTVIRNQELTKEIAEKIFKSESDLFKILMKGTSFEIKVWKALINISKGDTVCYEDVAKMTGNLRAVRAAANAVAKNAVAYLVPCHRVIKKDGSLHKYQWGSHVKKKILEMEKYHS